MSWIKGQYIWHVRCRRIRWSETVQLWWWRRRSAEMRDRMMAWRMGQLTCTPMLENTEVGGVTVDQFFRAAKTEEGKR